MKVLVTGARGQLGYDVMKTLRQRGIKSVGCDLYTDNDSDMLCLDLTDRNAVLNAVNALRPDAVIHCAAWTAVDAAEDEANRAAVYAVNAQATAYVAEACKQVQAKLMYISTDYVFGGNDTEPWQPDCMAFAPLNVYGASKLAGEEAVRGMLTHYFIVRIAWVFGAHGSNFVKTMLRAAEKHPVLRVVNDQIGTPTYTVHLARLLADMIVTERYGIYHATNEGGYISWYEFACEIFRQADIQVTVQPVTTAEYGLSKARRPMNSRLDKHKLAEAGFDPLPDWREALRDYLSGAETK